MAADASFPGKFSVLEVMCVNSVPGQSELSCKMLLKVRRSRVSILREVGTVPPHSSSFLSTAFIQHIFVEYLICTKCNVLHSHPMKLNFKKMDNVPDNLSLTTWPFDSSLCYWYVPLQMFWIHTQNVTPPLTLPRPSRSQWFWKQAFLCGFGLEFLIHHHHPLSS